MTRLIDADVLYNDIVRNCDNIAEAETFKAHYLDEQPTIEAEPVIRGKWIEHLILAEGFFQCSCCEFVSEALAAPRLYKYCPNCGAKMDLD